MDHLPHIALRHLGQVSDIGHRPALRRGQQIIARRNPTRSVAVRLIRCSRWPSAIDNGRTNTSGGRATAILPRRMITSGTRMNNTTSKINYRNNQR